MKEGCAADYTAEVRHHSQSISLQRRLCSLMSPPDLRCSDWCIHRIEDINKAVSAKQGQLATFIQI